MATRVRRNIRLWVSVPPEHDADLEAWAKRMGVTKSTLVSMTSQAGLRALIRTISPEQSFKPEEWAAIVGAMKQQGFDPALPTRTGTVKPKARSARVSK